MTDQIPPTGSGSGSGQVKPGATPQRSQVHKDTLERPPEEDSLELTPESLRMAEQQARENVGHVKKKSPQVAPKVGETGAVVEPTSADPTGQTGKSKSPSLDVSA